MIFNSDYDKSLWLMMVCDKENSEKINCFIRNIPSDLYLEIKERVSFIDDCKNKNIDINVKDICGSYDSDNKSYYYRFEPYKHGLVLGYNDIYNEEFEIILYPNNLEYSNNNDLSLIGVIHPYRNSFSYGDSRRLYFNNSFILSGSSFRFISLESSFRKIINVKLMNMNNIPLELEINKTDKGNMLIRKKNK